MNDTPKANKLHIGIFGKRNVGKSTLMNAILGQEMSIVSPVAGTTTDTVWKSMELNPIGPVVFVDTPGIDDEGELGELRVYKTKKTLEEVDAVIWVMNDTLDDIEKESIKVLREKNIPYIKVCNLQKNGSSGIEKNTIILNALTGKGIDKLKDELIKVLGGQQEKLCIGDCLNEGEVALLVIPQDIQAPKGRLILPQVQVLREILDARAIPIMTLPDQLQKTLEGLNTNPTVAIVDSQLFGKVEEKLPDDTKLTSFSIAMARQKGDLEAYIEGTKAIEKLDDNSKVLIIESCTHTPLHGDIAREKIPLSLKNKTKKNLEFEFIRGVDFPENLTEYQLVILCGGCMQTTKQIQYKIKQCIKQNVPVTNFGIILAYLNGSLERGTEIYMRT